MALPPGITPKSVTVGIASFFDGSLAEGTATITAPTNVVHTPTNRPIFSSQMSHRFVDGETSFNLCPTDAPGLNNVSWTYKLNVVISGALVQPEPVYFTLPTAGPDTIDLDSLVTVPSSAGTPIQATVVTSVNGQTGDVTVAAGGGLTGNLTDVGYDIFIIAGQSNAVGNGTGATSANIDVTDPRIRVYAGAGASASTIVQASDPLTFPTAVADPVGPGMEFARWYVDTAPGRRVLLVPSAFNATAFTTATQRWDATNTWPNDTNNLYNRTITLALAAQAAAGTNARFAGVLWVQGEGDVNASAATYRTHLEYLIDGLRDRLATPNLPFVIGSMTPEFIAQQAGGTTIDGVHQAIPTRKRYTAYALGPSGMSIDSGIPKVHYTTPGARELGRRMAAALGVARANTNPASYVAANPPAPPLLTLSNTVLPAITGTATTGSTLTSSTGTWSATPDSYAYQWKRAGANISGATASTYVLQVADEGTAVTVTVTASKSGYSGASATSASVTPTSAGTPALTNTVAPAITGTATTGSVLTVSNGTWSATPDSYTRQWKRAGTNISGATATTYTLVQADEGQAITCTVTAIKATYTNGTATSNSVTPSAVVTTYSADTFTRADNATTAGSTETGAFAWTATGCTGAITSNQIGLTSGVGNAVLVINDGQSNGTFTATRAAGSGSAGLVFRAVDSSNFYLLAPGNGGYTLFKNVAGAFGNIGAWAMTATATDVLSVIANGTSLTVKVNGATIGTVTDSAYTGTRHGFWSGATPSYFDNFTHTSATV